MTSETDEKTLAPRKAKASKPLLARLKQVSWVISLCISILSLVLTQIEPLRQFFASSDFFFSTPKTMRIVSAGGLLNFVPIVSITNVGKKTAVIDRIDMYLEKREAAGASYRRALRADGHYFEPSTSNPSWTPTIYPLHFIRLKPEEWLSANVIYRDSTDRKIQALSEFESKVTAYIRDAKRSLNQVALQNTTTWGFGPNNGEDLRRLLDANLEGFSAGTYHLLFAFTEVGKSRPSLVRAFSFEVLPDSIKGIREQKITTNSPTSVEPNQRFEWRVRLNPLTESDTVERLVSSYLATNPAP